MRDLIKEYNTTIRLRGLKRDLLEGGPWYFIASWPNRGIRMAPNRFSLPLAHRPLFATIAVMAIDLPLKDGVTARG